MSKHFYRQRAIAEGLVVGEQIFEKALPKVALPMYSLAAGTSCEVSKVTPLHWRKHTTKTELGFEKRESYENGTYTFRHLGYFIRVHRSKVKHRADVK